MERLQITLNGRIRRAMLNGREHLVAPMTSIVPGVLAGSRGPLLYPPDETGRNPEAWDGIPIVVGHPIRNGQPISARRPDIEESAGIGRLYDSTFSGGKLRHDGWFDVEKTRAHDLAHGTDIYDRLLRGESISISTGLFTDNEPAPDNAMHNGVRYTAIARRHRPDHLAVLMPDQKGACSLDDGCGINVNSVEDSGMEPFDHDNEDDIAAMTMNHAAEPEAGAGCQRVACADRATLDDAQMVPPTINWAELQRQERAEREARCGCRKPAENDPARDSDDDDVRAMTAYLGR